MSPADSAARWSALFGELEDGGVMARQLEGKRLLLVEDEALVAMMIADFLTDLGCAVVGTAASVSEGLAAIADNKSALDAAVLDVNLGGEKVYPIADELAQEGVPFIFSTGYNRAGIKADYAQVPMIAKPFEPEALEAILVLLLRPRPLHKVATGHPGLPRSPQLRPETIVGGADETGMSIQ